MIARKHPLDYDDRQNRRSVTDNSRTRRHEAARDAELGRKTLKARSKLYEMIVQFRMDAATVDDPRAQVLFELSAEMLAAMARSFRELDETPDPMKPSGR